MADPILRLDTEAVSVEPGGQARVMVTITSASSIVEGFALDVVGTQPAQWAEVVPASVSVFPGTDATAVVVFSPPAGVTAGSGTFAFGVRARSTESPDVSSVVEGDITLGKVSGLQARIVPVTSAGRWRGRHAIQLSNWGNSSVTLQLVASDPDAALGFYLRPDLVELPMGATTTVSMTVRTRRPFLRGTPVRLPFQVTGEPVDAPPGPRGGPAYGDPTRPVVDGALTQKPILSTGFVAALALLLVVAVAGFAYAWTRTPASTSLEQLGPPGRPATFAVDPAGPGALKASWTPLDQVTGYELQDIDPADLTSVRDVQTVSGSQNQVLKQNLQPDTRYCYRVKALRGAAAGPLTEVDCEATEPSTVTTPPVDPLAGGKWVLVVRIGPDSGAVVPALEKCVDDLLDNKVTNVHLIPPNTYRRLRLTPTTDERKDTWMVAVGPYDDRTQAVTLGAQAAKICHSQPAFPVQPDPPQ